MEGPSRQIKVTARDQLIIDSPVGDHNLPESMLYSFLRVSEMSLSVAILKVKENR